MFKTYIVKGITDEDWEEIFSCLSFAAKFTDSSLKNNISEKIQIRDLDQDKDVKKYIEKWLWKGD